MLQESILVVSDEPTTRNLLIQALSSYDGPVMAVEGAAQAIATLNDGRVAVVILDWPLVQIQDIVLHAHRAQPEAFLIGLLAEDGDVASTALVTHQGVDDCLVKPPPSNLVRLAVDRALEWRRLKRKAEWLALVNRVGQQITSILNMDQLLWEVARLIQESFDFYYVDIALLDGDTAEIKAAVGGERGWLPPIGVRCKLQDSQEMIAQALSRRAPLLIANTQDMPQLTFSQGLCQTRSALVMPIALQDQLLGALKVLNVEPHAFEPADLPVFESLAAQIAAAVQNAHLFAERKRHEETLHSLNAAAVAMQRVITSQTKVLKVMTSELGHSGFVSLVHLQDPHSASVNLIHSSLSPRLIKALTELLDTPPGEWPLDLARAPIYRQVLDERCTVFVERVEPLVGQIVPVALPPGKIDLIVRILGHPHAIIAPMLLGDQVIGWLTVFSAQITAQDRPTITAFANQAAVALGNARLLASARRADELILINQVGQAMAATLEFDEVLQLLLQTVASTVQVDECVVALWDEATQRHVPQARLLKGQVADGDTSISECSLPPIRIPLVGHKQELGLLALDRHSDGRELSAKDLQLVRTLANQAASAMENARLYSELKQSATELEYSQRHLIQTEKLVATGRLAASIAHEINNPLQAIKNCLELILDETEAGEPLDRTLLDVATSELERIRGIIQQMLDLYRPKRAPSAPIDVNAALEGVLALMRQQLESHHIAIETHLDSARPSVIGRDDQLRQVFINLILNAIEAMSQGGQITITTRQDREGTVVIQITDTGIGIAPEDLTRIADPFFTTKSKGVGLGLTICHEIIERHQGTLDVTSQVGHGSTFTIRLGQKS
jgi:signal transduction histidine kinase/FixJ family two-component response regulator